MARKKEHPEHDFTDPNRIHKILDLLREGADATEVEKGLRRLHQQMMTREGEDRGNESQQRVADAIYKLYPSAAVTISENNSPDDVAGKDITALLPNGLYIFLQVKSSGYQITEFEDRARESFGLTREQYKQ